jgi:hypothetical protein
VISSDELENIACRAAASVSKRVGNVEPLEDLQQEARMAILLALLSFRDGGMDLHGYLFVKARNACIDYIRALHGKHGGRPKVDCLDDSLGLIHDDFAAIDRKDSHKKARRIQRMREKEIPEPTPKETAGGPGKLGGPVTICGILFERVSNGVLLTMPNGQSATCSLLDLQRAMALLFGTLKK